MEATRGTVPTPFVFFFAHPKQKLSSSSSSCSSVKPYGSSSVSVLSSRVIRVVNFPSSSNRNGEVGLSVKSQAQRSSFSDSTSSSSAGVVEYEGAYGTWSVDSSDVREVILYRSGLVTAAASFVIAASTAFLPQNSSLGDIIKNNLDIFYALGAGGLGLSLVLIHIYVTEIKRALQALWALGVLGSLATYLTLAQPAGDNLIQYVIDNPMAVWFVGPLFAALTGLIFKEGLCYGKLEAGILTFVIPSLLLGHLSGFMDDKVKVGLLGVWMGLFVVFAGRKFTQPIKDDIGDKSVFMFKALPEEQKKALIEELEQQSSAKIVARK